MEKRVEILNQLYNSQDENGRLCNSRHGQLEYMTTMHFIHQYLKPESKIIEIGAGTDSILELAENRKDFKMGDHDFNQFYKYHLSCCERRELLAASNHLYIYEILSDRGLSYGVQYFCNIKELAEIPDFEMDKLELVDEVPFERMKTPQLHSLLIKDINNILNYGIF